MIFHRVEKKAKGKKFVYDIELVERQFFMETKLAVVMADIKKEEEAETLVQVLESGFRNGVAAVERKIGREIKL